MAGALALASCVTATPEHEREAVLLFALEIKEQAVAVESLRESGVISLDQALTAKDHLIDAHEANKAAARFLCVDLGTGVADGCRPNYVSGEDRLHRVRAGVSYVRKLLEHNR